MLVGPPSEVIRWRDRCRGLMVHTAQAGFVPQLQLLEEKASPISPTWGFRGGSVLQNLPANAEDMGPIPGSGRSPGEEMATHFQYFCLENPMDRGARQAIGHGIAKQSDTT